ncbi:MBL fold metallo-hydrolase [Cytophaga aurantiaca]|uniref:MBL fold metallo-hydrolase n=1 Tax=Cytophaga aurantiaca TaxID=29530 RepID=UPI000376D604|nr:MBL fold metallo-hydrolase [Cytophaga aurantiaca]
MVQETEITFQLFASGYCTANAKIIDPTSALKSSRFYAVWALLKHPSLGLVLFDCGYNELFQKETQSFPEILYRWATPAHIPKEQTAKYLLEEKGIKPEDIHYIIVSHFHADHVCALRDFPNAQFICNQSSLDEYRSVSGFSALKKGIIKKLIPPDFESRVIVLQNISTSYVDVNSGLLFHRFFDQDVFELIELPGHAKGMQGIKVNLSDKKIVYATDAAWSKEAFNKGILPMKIVKLFFDSWKAYKNTFTALKKYEANHPDYTVLFTHCPETLQLIENNV